ncbi:response regulator transcription factor [Paraburkholderia sp. BCC1885]|uniref:response regulator n=1 Tax=Paraburkholderia sp. BCC1885 TaxID=2562669 RepID=UPI001183ECC9|nr:response regulator transcription factor [Paraburkholderia sp. BCC1885]
MIKVVIADAHAVTRNGVRHALESAGGFEVVGEACDGESTLTLVCSTDASMLVLGLTMPGIHGIPLIGLVRERNPSLRILVLTRHSEAAYAARAFRAGASGFVSKRSPAADLVVAAAKVASGGIYISLAVAEQLAQRFDRSANALPHQLLSDRELDVFLLVAVGEAVSAIAQTPGVSVKTVSTHKARIFEKTGLPNDAALVRYAFDHELVVDDGKGDLPGR